MIAGEDNRQRSGGKIADISHHKTVDRGGRISLMGGGEGVVIRGIKLNFVVVCSLFDRKGDLEGVTDLIAGSEVDFCRIGARGKPTDGSKDKAGFLAAAKHAGGLIDAELVGIAATEGDL